MSYKALVKEILTKSELAKDDDQHLYSIVLANKGFDIINEQAYSLVRKVRNKQLPSLDTVTRLRRMLQMENPNLRGKVYDLRHGKKVQKALSDIGY